VRSRRKLDAYFEHRGNGTRRRRDSTVVAGAVWKSTQPFLLSAASKFLIGPNLVLDDWPRCGAELFRMKSLVGRALTYAASGVVSQGAVFLLWLAIPWFLVPAEVGYLTLALFAVEFLTMLGLLGMDAALFRFAIKPDTRGAAFGVALVLSGTALVLLAGLVLVLARIEAGRGLFGNTTAWVTDHYGLILAAVAGNIAWNLVQSIQIASRQVEGYAVLQIARAATQLVLGLCALAFLEGDAATVLGAITVASFGVLLLRRQISLPAVRGNPFHAPETGLMVRYGLSMMIYGLLGVAFVYTQRLVVSHYEDIAVLGIFAFFNVIVLQVNGLWGAFNKAWTPEIFALMETNPVHALNLLRGMLTLLCVVYPLVLAILVVAGEAFLVDLLFPAAYAAQSLIFWLLMLSLLFTGLYTIAYPLYYYELRTRRILTITIFLGAANVALSVAFIRAWGVEGAAASFLLVTVLSTWTYLAAYRDWVDGRLPALLAAVTTMVGGAAILLLVTRSVWMFVTMLFATSMIAWMLGGSAARPLIWSLVERIRFER